MHHLHYLRRINYHGELRVSAATLKALQRAHLFAVPFENLDIHTGKPIELANSFDKVVRRGRGGFCYELNPLFAELLQALGFTVKLVSGRVYTRRKGFGPEFDHLALIVSVDGEDYLVDVGYGDFTFEPLRVVLDVVQADARGDFLITRHEAGYLLVQKLAGAERVPEYLFSEQARELPEFAAMCHYHQTSPASHFTQRRVCSLPTATGRVTISGARLLITEGGAITETPLETEEAYREALRRYFGMEG